VAKIFLSKGEWMTIIHGTRLRMREVEGPKGGKKTQYQAASADPVTGKWYDTPGKAANDRGEGYGKPPARDRALSRAQWRPTGRKTVCMKKRVIEILRSYHGLSLQQATRLVKKHGVFVKARCKEGQPASLLAWDLTRLAHLSQRDPGRSSHKSTLVQGRRIIKRFSSRKAAVHAAKRWVEKTGRPVDILTTASHRRGRRSARDAEHPYVGEIFETKAGQRWEIIEVSDTRIKVRRRGAKPKSEGPFVWGKTALKPLKTVNKYDIDKEGADKPAESPAMAKTHAFPASKSFWTRDPDKRAKKTGVRQKRKAAVRRRAGERAKKPGALCSNAPVLARKRMLASGDRPPHASDKPSKFQTLVFERYCWTVPQAKAWAKRHGKKYKKVDVTEKEIRLRQRPPSTMKIVGSMPLKRGLRAVLGVIKRGKRS
jgi:hypothetical protein